MTPIAQWQLRTPDFRFTAWKVTSAAVTTIVVLLQDKDQSSGTTWDIYNLGNGNVALGAQVDDWGYYYWNNHWGMLPDTNIWLRADWESYGSDKIGPEQTFRLQNLGHERVSLQGYIFGGKVTSNSTVELDVMGDPLPILQITNSGYLLSLNSRNFGPLDLTGADMRQCDLRGSDLSQLKSVQGADFTEAHLGSDGYGTAKLDNLDLSQAKTWFRAQFDATNLTTIKTAAGAWMEQATFLKANLSKANFGGAHLAGAVFAGATLDGTDFTGADLSGADFSGASLKETKFSGAVMHGTIFNGADLSSAVFDASPNFARAGDGRTQFQGATVPFKLLNSNWSYLDLTGANITNMPKNLGNLNADQAVLDNLNLQGVDLTGASFRGTRMYGVQLQRANLQGATMTDALLKGAWLNGANLSLANLSRAWLIVETATTKTPKDKLEAASLSGAFMFNTILDGAHCDGWIFPGPGSIQQRDQRPARQRRRRFHERRPVQRRLDPRSAFQWRTALRGQPEQRGFAGLGLHGHWPDRRRTHPVAPR